MFNKARLIGSAASSAIAGALASNAFFNAAKEIANSSAENERGKRARDIDTYTDKRGRKFRRGNSGKIPMPAKPIDPEFKAKVEANRGVNDRRWDGYLNSHARSMRAMFRPENAMPSRAKARDEFERIGR